MIQLSSHGQPINTVFDLLGRDEDDITYSVGWALAQSPRLRQRFMAVVIPHRKAGEVTGVQLQQFGGDRGFTDIEIIAERAHVIVEAKRGWTLPPRRQLQRYAHRLKGGQQANAIVVVAECLPEYAQGRLPTTVYRIPVHYLSWKQIYGFARESRGAGALAERSVLRELCGYLRGVMSMQNQETNLVYVLALSTDQPDWSSLNWIEFVTRRRRYFHPYGGNGWPTEPANYLGFRYGGCLQSIHHVEGYTITEDLWKQIPEIDRRGWQAAGYGPMLVYRLGPPITPNHLVKTGDIYRSGRVRAALDLLLTCHTISEARDKTKKRLAKVT